MKKNIIQANKQFTIIKLGDCKLIREKRVKRKHSLIKKRIRPIIKRPIIKKIIVVHKKNMVQDCVETKWTVYDSTPVNVYQANKSVASSGVIDFSNATTGITQVTMRFLNGASEIASYIIYDKQSLAFSVDGFDTITLVGNGISDQDSATGSLSLTPRYVVH